MPTGASTIELHRAFAQTEYGQRLSSSVRYGRYMPEGVSNNQWVDLLGADVNNLEHMRLTAGLTYDFMRSMDELAPGELTYEDRLLLPVGAISHDWGEAIVTDITYSKKTDEDECREKVAFLDIVSETMSDIPESSLVVRAAHNVVFDRRGTRQGRMFNAIERVGYMRTALRAHVKLDSITDPQLANGLRWIVADVLGNQPVHLMAAAGDFPPIQRFLMNLRDNISEAFNDVDDTVFANSDLEEEETKRLAVAQNFALWHGWLDQQEA